MDIQSHHYLYNSLRCRGFLIGILLCVLPALIGAQTVFNVPMRDGVRLSTAVFLPPDTAFAPVPAVLCRNPYGKGPGGVLQDSLFAHGIGFVSQDTRGRGASEGIDSLFLNDGWGEKRDGYDTIEWLAEQGWCDGRIGLFGGSAFGITAYLCAGADPPHLVCGFVLQCASDLYRHAVFPGGCYRKEQVDSWTLLMGLDHIRNLMIDNYIYNSLWDLVNIGTRLDSIHVPFYHVAGWYDTFCEGNIYAFSALNSQGGAGAQNNQKLRVGPWTHGNWFQQKQGDLYYPVNSLWDYIPEAIRWFACHLKGAANGIMEEDPVTVYAMGGVDGILCEGVNQWVAHEAWPPVQIRSDTLYMYADNTILPLKPAYADSGLSYSYDPERPLMNWGGRNLAWPAGPRNQLLQDLAEQNIIWTGTASDDPLIIAGPVGTELYFGSDRVDTDVMVRLEDVYPDNRSYLITDGALRLRFREGCASEKFMVPGEIVRFRVDLGNIYYVLKPGHALRIGVSSSLFPRYDKNVNTGEPYTMESDTLIAQNTVYTGMLNPSSIILPVLDGHTSVMIQTEGVPEAFTLYQNFPNPFNSATTLVYTCKTPCHVSLRIFNVRGECVEVLDSGLKPAGVHEVNWDAGGHSSGLYFAVLVTGSDKKVIKCTLLK